MMCSLVSVALVDGTGDRAVAGKLDLCRSYATERTDQDAHVPLRVGQNVKSASVPRPFIMLLFAPLFPNRQAVIWPFVMETTVQVINIA